MEHDHHPKEDTSHTHAHHLNHHGHQHQVHDHHHQSRAAGRSHRHFYRSTERKKLQLVMALTGSMMVAEAIGGILTNSLALLSDAFHMLTHFFAISVSFFAIALACRKAPAEKSFGYWRIEVLSALFNGITLVPIVGYIIYESYQRLVNPSPIKEIPMLAVAVLGFIVNVASALILMGSSKHDINVRGAFLHMIGDTASSVGVMTAAVVIHFSKWYILDPIASVLIAIVILIWSIGLVWDSLRILLEATPKHIKISEVENSIRKVAGVKEVHDIHIWEITSNMYAMTAHVTVPNLRLSETQSILHQINHDLDDNFDITHTNIQFETE